MWFSRCQIEAYYHRDGQARSCNVCVCCFRGSIPEIDECVKFVFISERRSPRASRQLLQL